MFGALRGFVIAAVLLVSSASIAQVQVNQTFIPQGPSPKFGPIDVVQSADAPPNGTVAGAVQTILLDPALGPQTLFIGGVNGGIWRTTNGGTTWTPLTDNQGSPSIASMALDPSDPTGKTLIAGVGITSNGAWDHFNLAGVSGRGGARTGLLYSTDGGNTWSAMGGGPYLTGQSVIGVAAAGSTILAATFEEQGPRLTTASTGASYGLYLSNNGGKSFSLVQPSSGLPAGPVTALVADPQNPGNCGARQSCTFYASITSASNPSAAGVYVTHTSGQSWSSVFTSTTVPKDGTNVLNGATFQMVPKLAAGPNGSVAIAIAQLQPQPPNGNGQQLTGLYLSQDGGTSWSKLKTPDTNKGVMQAAVNLAVAIDPTDTKTVYVTGDGIVGNPYTVPAFRVHGDQVTPLTFANTSNGSSAHSDSRGLVVDPSGNLWMTSDGGVYMRSDPQHDTGAWTGFNTSTLQVQQTYGIAYDTLSKRAAAAMQDTGVAIQASRGSASWDALAGADGTSVSINGNFTTNTSALYLTTDTLGAVGRIVYDANGKRISPDTGPAFAPATPINCTYNPLSGGYAGCAAYVPDPNNPGSFTNNSPFLAPLVLNRVNPTQIAIAPGYQNFNGVTGNFVYVAQDTTPASASSVTLQTASVGTVSDDATVLALAYGIPANNNQGASAFPNALLAGVKNGGVGELWFSSNVQVAPLLRLPAYAQAGGLSPTAMVFDPSSQVSPGQTRFYVADSVNLWGTNNQGAQINSLTGNLPAGFSRPTAVEFISNNGVNALLVGGLLTPLTCDSSPNGCIISSTQSPITVADSDGSGNLSGWRAFGQGLPNTLVAQLVYYPSVDLLLAGAVGRGVFTLYDVTSYFAQATALQFGLANNDSRPDASFLTDGTSLNGTGFSRPLNKYGTGTLTIAGSATYTGGTGIFGGALQLGTGGAGGSILGNVAFCSDGNNPLCDASTNKMLVFNRSNTYTFDGAISGPGQVVQFGSGKTVLTAANTYSGPTYVLGGTLSVNGSIASSPVFVNFGGTLGGNGTVGPTTILAGGALSPGNSVGTLTVNGNLVFAAASLYMVEVQGNSADRTNASGTATLAGTVALSYLGGRLARNYTVLSAAGGRTGTFDSLVAANLPAFLTASLGYTPTDVQLNLTSGVRRITGLTRNHGAVAAALDKAFDSAGSLFHLYGLTPSQIRAALDMLSGEGVSGTQETAFGAAGMFTSIMMDQGAFWRAGDTVDVNGVSFAPLPYAPAKKSKTDHPAFKAMLTKEPPMVRPRWRAWVTGFDATAKLNGERDIGSADLSHNVAGLAGGLDYQFAPDLLAGLAIGGSSSNFSVRERITSGHLEGAHFGGYAVKTWRELYAAAALSFSTFRNSETRSIVGIGPAETASGSFGSNLLSGRLEAGWKQAWGWFSVTPFAAVQVSQLWQNGFTETNPLPAGAVDPLGLAFGARSVTSLPTFLGAQFDTRFAFRNGMALAPYARVSWVHEFKPDRAINASFIALPAAAFTVDGPRAASDAARIDAGAKLAIAPNAWLFASFDGEFSSRSQSYAGKAGAKISW